MEYMQKRMDLLNLICAHILDGKLEELHTQIIQFDLIYSNLIKSDEFDLCSHLWWWTRGDPCPDIINVIYIYSIQFDLFKFNQIWRIWFYAHIFDGEREEIHAQILSM